ncbi:MAG: hypothetical protein HQ549_05370 [Candidatus Omnitrophica bacterium]|nr:hypothetical protein [Candidatus Omnitrophota bacterium]
MEDARQKRHNNNLLRHKGPIRAVALITAIAFFITSLPLDFAWAAKKPLELTRVSSNRTGGPGTLNPETFTLPPSLGHVNASSSPGVTATTNRTIIHIQDSHCDYGCQKSIESIINYLNTEYDVDLAFLEGGAGNYDLSVFTDIKDKTSRGKLADYFVKEGRVTGAELFGIMNPEKITLKGLEDPKLYFADLSAYRESLQYKTHREEILKTLEHYLNNLKRDIYSSSLKEFENEKRAFTGGKSELHKYLASLAETAQKSGIDITKYENFSNFIQLATLEKDIDLKTTNSERNNLIDSLSKRLSKTEIETLVRKSLAFKQGNIDSAEFYAYLFKKAKPAYINVSEKCPELFKYKKYVDKFKSLDKQALFDEIETLEAEIAESLFGNDTQKELYALSKGLSILKDLFKASITRGDYDYYVKNKSSLNTKHFSSFITRESPKYKINANLPDDIKRLDSYREKTEKFYKIAFKRDHAFLKNIELAFKKPPDTKRPTIRQTPPRPQAAIIVTGGFHGKNLEKLLAKKGYSYIGILPKFKKRKNRPYFKLLSGGLIKEEEIIRDAISTRALAIQSMFSEMGVSANEPDISRLAVILRRTTDAGKDFVLEFKDETGRLVRRERFMRDSDNEYVKAEPEIADPGHELTPINLAEAQDKLEAVEVALAEYKSASIDRGGLQHESHTQVIPNIMGGPDVIIDYDVDCKIGDDPHALVWASVSIRGEAQPVGRFSFKIGLDNSRAKKIELRQYYPIGPFGSPVWEAHQNKGISQTCLYWLSTLGVALNIDEITKSTPRLFELHVFRKYFADNVEIDGKSHSTQESDNVGIYDKDICGTVAILDDSKNITGQCTLEYIKDSRNKYRVTDTDSSVPSIGSTLEIRKGYLYDNLGQCLGVAQRSDAEEVRFYGKPKIPNDIQKPDIEIEIPESIKELLGGSDKPSPAAVHTLPNAMLRFISHRISNRLAERIVRIHENSHWFMDWITGRGDGEVIVLRDEDGYVIGGKYLTRDAFIIDNIPITEGMDKGDLTRAVRNVEGLSGEYRTFLMGFDYRDYRNYTVEQLKEELKHGAGFRHPRLVTLAGPLGVLGVGGIPSLITGLIMHSFGIDPLIIWTTITAIMSPFLILEIANLNPFNSRSDFHRAFFRMRTGEARTGEPQPTTPENEKELARVRERLRRKVAIVTDDMLEKYLPPEGLKWDNDGWRKLLVTPLRGGSEPLYPSITFPMFVERENNILNSAGINLDEFTRDREIVILGFTGAEFYEIAEQCPNASRYHLVNYSQEAIIEEGNYVWNMFPELRERVSVYNIDAEEIGEHIPSNSICLLRATGIFSYEYSTELRMKRIRDIARKVVLPDGVIMLRFSAGPTEWQDSERERISKEIENDAGVIFAEGIYFIFKNSAAPEAEGEVPTLTRGFWQKIPVIGKLLAWLQMTWHEARHAMVDRFRGEIDFNEGVYKATKGESFKHPALVAIAPYAITLIQVLLTLFLTHDLFFEMPLFAAPLYTKVIAIVVTGLVVLDDALNLALSFSKKHPKSDLKQFVRALRGEPVDEVHTETGQPADRESAEAVDAEMQALIDRYQRIKGFNKLNRRQLRDILKVASALENTGARVEEFEKTVRVDIGDPKRPLDSSRTSVKADMVISRENETGKTEEWLVEIKIPKQASAEQAIDTFFKPERGEHKQWERYEIVINNTHYVGVILAITRFHPDHELGKIEPIEEKEGFHSFFTVEGTTEYSPGEIKPDEAAPRELAAAQDYYAQLPADRRDLLDTFMQNYPEDPVLRNIVAAVMLDRADGGIERDEAIQAISVHLGESNTARAEALLTQLRSAGILSMAKKPEPTPLDAGGPAFTWHFTEEADRERAILQGTAFVDALDEFLNTINLGIYNKDITDACGEMVFNIIMHGGGGNIEVRYTEDAGGSKKLEVIGIDEGPGMENPDALLQESINTDKTHRAWLDDGTIQRPDEGYGLRIIVIFPDNVTIETRGERWVKRGKCLRFGEYSLEIVEEIESTLRLERVDAPDPVVEKGTRITLTWEKKEEGEVGLPDREASAPEPSQPAVRESAEPTLPPQGGGRSDLTEHAQDAATSAENLVQHVIGNPYPHIIVTIVDALWMSPTDMADPSQPARGDMHKLKKFGRLLMSNRAISDDLKQAFEDRYGALTSEALKRGDYVQKTPMVDQSETVQKRVKRCIYDLYIELYLKLGWAQEIPGTNNVTIDELTNVKYGKFQITFNEIFDELAEFAEIKNGTKVFEFGSGDGSTAYKMASYGASVDGMEVEESLFLVSNSVRQWFLNMIARNFDGTLDPEVASNLTEVVNRVHFEHKDIFNANVDFSEYDIVYLYYPEPDQNKQEFLDQLNAIMSHPERGLREDAKLVILRQGSDNAIPLQGLEIIDSKTVPITLSKYIEACTFYKYQRKKATTPGPPEFAVKQAPVEESPRVDTGDYGFAPKMVTPPMDREHLEETIKQGQKAVEAVGMIPPCTVVVAVKSESDKFSVLSECNSFANRLKTSGNRMAKWMNIENESGPIKFLVYVDDGTTSDENMARMDKVVTDIEGIKAANPQETVFTWILKDDRRKDASEYQARLASLRELGAHIAALQGEYVPAVPQMQIGLLMAKLIDFKKQGNGDEGSISATVNAIIESINRLTRKNYDSLKAELQLADIEKLSELLNGSFVLVLPDIELEDADTAMSDFRRCESQTMSSL